MANKITYADKIGLIAKAIHVNQWWDDDANEIKSKFNLNDDRTTVLESLITDLPWVNIEDIADLTAEASPGAGDKLVIEVAGVKKYVTFSQFVNSVTAHDLLTNLDFASAGHTGFEETLTFGTGLERIANAVTSKDSEINHNDLNQYDADRHFLESEIEITVSQISDWDANKPIYEMQLPASLDVAGRVSGAVLPSGWSLVASGVDLIVTHNLSRRVMDVKVWAVTGVEEQQLRNTASDNGLVTTDANTLKIQSLATINKVLKVYISFAE